MAMLANLIHCINKRVAGRPEQAAGKDFLVERRRFLCPIAQTHERLRCNPLKILSWR